LAFAGLGALLGFVSSLLSPCNNKAESRYKYKHYLWQTIIEEYYALHGFDKGWQFRNDYPFAVSTHCGIVSVIAIVPTPCSHHSFQSNSNWFRLMSKKQGEINWKSSPLCCFWEWMRGYHYIDWDYPLCWIPSSCLTVCFDKTASQMHRCIILNSSGSSISDSLKNIVLRICIFNEKCIK